MMGLTFPLSVLACLAVAQHGAVSAPLGALQADGHLTEAQRKHSADSGSPLGAPRMFDLFFPKPPRHYTSGQYSSTPKYKPVEEITNRQQAVPVVPLPISSEEVDQKAYIPVIQLPNDSNKEDGEISSDTPPTFLDMFPEDLLNSDKIVKPIQIHIIEHDDYIDYEIEFIELSMDQASKIEDYPQYFPDTKISSPSSDNDNGEQRKPTIRNSQTNAFQGVTGSTFLDLLKRARTRHKENNELLKQSVRENVTSITIPKGNKNPINNVRERSIDRRPTKIRKTPRKLVLGEHQLWRNSNRKMRNNQKHMRGVKKVGTILKYNNNRRSTTPSSGFVETEITTLMSSENLDNQRNQNTNEKHPGHSMSFEENITPNILAITSKITPNTTTTIPLTFSKFNNTTEISEDITFLPTTTEITSLKYIEETTSSSEVPARTELPDEDKIYARSTVLPLIDDQLIPISEVEEDITFLPTTNEITSLQDTEQTTSSFEVAARTELPDKVKIPTRSTVLPLIDEQLIPISEVEEDITFLPMINEITNLKDIEETTSSSEVPARTELPDKVKIPARSTVLPLIDDQLIPISEVEEDITFLPTNNEITSSQDIEQTTSSYEVQATTKLPDEDKISARSTVLLFIDEHLIHISERKENNDLPTDYPPLKTKKVDQHFVAEDLEPSESRSIFSPDFNSEVFTQMPTTSFISLSDDIKASPPELPRGPYIQNRNSDLTNRLAGIPTKQLLTIKHLGNLETMFDKNSKIEMETVTELDTTSVTIETTTISQHQTDDSQLFETRTECNTSKSEDFLEGLYHESNPGQYHEVNPGQYHEINPGQDKEIHPGQDEESNPGQYHEINPGQYHESNPGQFKEDLGVDNVKVDFDHNLEQDTQTYNVIANAGDFIIGEVGRIDVNSGQTLQGVRYTAVEGEVDQARISDILKRFFGTRTK